MRHLLYMICLLLGSAALAQDNPIVNPGFEQQTAPWGLTTEASLATEKPHSGQACLKLTRTDKTAYTLPTQDFKLEPGRPYVISAWVRTEQVSEGQGGGATICLQWTKQGAFYGGEYPRGVWGTTDWTLVTALAKVPPDADPTVGITCYLRREATGVAWFDDLSVQPVTDYPPVAGVCTYAYRNTTAGAPVRVAAQLELLWAGLKPETAPLRLQLRAADGKVMLTAKPTQVSMVAAQFVLDCSRLKPGAYVLACGLEGPGGKLTAERTCTLRRVAKYPPRYAYLDEHKRLIVDGKPFFPLGTYWNTHYHREDHTPAQRQAIYAKYPSSRDRKLLDLYAQSPFNCLMPYDSWTWQTEDLDYAHQLGLSVLFSVKDSFYGLCNAYGIKSEAGEREAIEREVKRVQSHPAIIAWYTNDEVAPDDPRLLKHQQWLEELDPGRPTWSVSYHDHTAYLGTCDAYGMDCYPVAWAAPAMVLGQVRASAEGAGLSRALWHVPQICDMGVYGKDIHQSRPPTLIEMRSMAWMCITGGANGLIFYSFFDLLKAEDVTPFATRWADVTQMAREIKDLEPVLLSIDPAPQPEQVRDADGAVSWRLYAYEGKTYLTAVNSASVAHTASFRFPRAFTTVEPVLGHSPTTLTGRRVQLSFDPLEVKVVRLTP